jgi:hypothetical protein
MVMMQGVAHECLPNIPPSLPFVFARDALRSVLHSVILRAPTYLIERIVEPTVEIAIERIRVFAHLNALASTWAFDALFENALADRIDQRYAGLGSARKTYLAQHTHECARFAIPFGDDFECRIGRI